MTKFPSGLALLSAIATSTTVTSNAAHAQSLAFTSVTVIDVREGVARPDMTVIVTDGHITAVRPADSVGVPAGAHIVDGTGKYLIPGLWDMHVHSVANVAVDMEASSVAAMDWHFPLFVAHGVTGVRNMNDGTADVTLELTNSVRRRLTEGELLGPRLLANGPSIDGDPPLPANPVVVRTAAEARAVVDRLSDAGADFVKPYENLPREAYFALIDQARRRGLPVDGHVPFRVTPEEAAEAGQRTVEHPEALAAGCSTAAEAARERFDRALSEFDRLPDDEKFLAQFRYYHALYESWDPAACRPMFEAYRRNGVAVAADLVAYHHVVHAGEILSDTVTVRLVPAPIRRNWEVSLDSETMRKFQSILRPIIPAQAEQVRLFNEAGGTLLAATDVGIPWQVPGVSLHQDLKLLVEAGLTPLEALRAATLNPATVLGTTDSLGTIEEGKLADLVLLDADPLTDIANTREIRAVVLDGRYLDRATLDELLTEVERTASRPHEAVRDSLPLDRRPPAGQVQRDIATPDTTEVLAAVETFLTAFENADWEPFIESFGSSSTLFSPFGSPWRKVGREEIGGLFRPIFERVRASGDGPPYGDLDPKDLQIDPLGEGAVVSFHLPGQEQVGRRTLVFGRDEPTDPWRIVHLHASGLAQRGEEAAAGASHDPRDPETVVMRQVEAYNAHDLDAFLRYYHEEATYYNLGPDTSYIESGKAALRESFSFLNGAPDGFGVDVTDTLVTGPFVVLAERLRHTPADRPGALVVYEVREGLIRNTWIHNPEPIRRSVAVEEGEWPKAELTAAELKRYEGRYGASGQPVTVALNDEDRLQLSFGGETFQLVPEGDHVFAHGHYENGRLVEILHPQVRVVFQLEEGEVVGYELRRAEGGAVLPHVPRIR